MAELRHVGRERGRDFRDLRIFRLTDLSDGGKSLEEGLVGLGHPEEGLGSSGHDRGEHLQSSFALPKN